MSAPKSVFSITASCSSKRRFIRSN
jgi:hypothetical protein